MNIKIDNQRNILEHLEKIKNSKCLHDQCTECHGSGVTSKGDQCIHHISCPCPKCTPSYM